MALLRKKIVHGCKSCGTCSECVVWMKVFALKNVEMQLGQYFFIRYPWQMTRRSVQPAAVRTPKPDMLWEQQGGSDQEAGAIAIERYCEEVQFLFGFFSFLG